MQNIDLNAYWDKAITLDEYFDIHKQQAEEGSTSGNTQSDSLIQYTKLNYSRSKRGLKNLDLKSLPFNVTPINAECRVLIISETWCGDSAQVLPVLSKMENLIDRLHFKVIWRDENLDLMDAYLTNGGRSIPKLIAFDEAGQETFSWGPRPKLAQDMVMAYKQKSEPKESYDEFSVQLQKWYNQNGGEDIVKELWQHIQLVQA